MSPTNSKPRRIHNCSLPTDQPRHVGFVSSPGAVTNGVTYCHPSVSLKSDDLSDPLLSFPVSLPFPSFPYSFSSPLSSFPIPFPCPCSPFRFPSPSLLSPLEVGPFKPSYRVWGAPSEGSRADHQPKSNLVHFSFQIWHLVRAILVMAKKPLSRCK